MAIRDINILYLISISLESNATSYSNKASRCIINFDFYFIIAASYFLYLLISYNSPNMHFHRVAYGLELFTNRAHFDDERSLRFEHRFATALNRTQEFMNYFAM